MPLSPRTVLDLVAVAPSSLPPHGQPWLLQGRSLWLRGRAVILALAFPPLSTSSMLWPRSHRGCGCCGVIGRCCGVARSPLTCPCHCSRRLRRGCCRRIVAVAADVSTLSAHQWEQRRNMDVRESHKMYLLALRVWFRVRSMSDC